MSATGWCNVHNIENRLPSPEFLGLSGPSIHVHLSPFMSIRVNDSVARSLGRTTSVTVHDGAYSYDNGVRLSQVIDSATNLTEEYTWNADNTLATMPGPNYTREFGYNEEAELLSISHSGTLVYQYAYGADGNRRWAKDIANNVWTWYPCGDLAQITQMITATTWRKRTTFALIYAIGLQCGASSDNFNRPSGLNPGSRGRLKPR